MNGIFFAIVTLSVAALTLTDPDKALSAMLDGGSRAIELTVTMLAVYTVWLGILKIAEQCGVTEGLARLLKKPIRLLFGNVGGKAQEYISMNISANLLGMGGVATPMGISAAAELDKTGNVFASHMLFVLSATSIQLLPTSVIALRAEAGSLAASDILLPTLLSTTVSTAIGICLLYLFCGKQKR